MVRKKLGIYQSCAIFSQINKKGKSVRIRSVDMLSIFPFFHEVAEPFTHVLFLACEQAPGEDGKKIPASAKQKNSESKAIGAGTGEPVDFVFDLPIRPW